MRQRSIFFRWVFGCTVLVFFGVFSAVTAEAGTKIASMGDFEGTVLHVSCIDVFAAESGGGDVCNGDMVQTGETPAKVVFPDGTRVTVAPYSSVMFQEIRIPPPPGSEGKDQITRRITALVGKIGAERDDAGEGPRTYFQTPQSTAAYRGKNSDWGFDNEKSYLSGDSRGSTGGFLTGKFKDPGKKPALANPVYQALLKAAEEDDALKKRELVAEAMRASMEALQVNSSQAARDAARDLCMMNLDGNECGCPEIITENAQAMCEMVELGLPMAGPVESASGVLGTDTAAPFTPGDPRYQGAVEAPEIPVSNPQ